ncbi:hypothetical protein [Chromobacterium paludis]|uniref:Uncharacterized protein n=1 Tax=Chromobacterium paludis TaxID=2605945 RepID=A0A5C1DHQ1_9NEIS|nr:hypothetical protein [Chromobacterium paludis]QEL55479.1 hypothetical protein FYK34_07830 [Chromobacterium paludis]
MKHENFRITYDGPALQTHEIDVRVLAPALLAVGDVLEHANRVLNDGRAKVSVNVKGSLKTGSVNIDFALVQGFLSHAVDLLTGKEVTATLALMSFLGISAKDGLNSVIKVIRWTRGRAVHKIETEEGKATLYIDEESLEVELEVLELIRDYELRRALEAMLEPLEREGIDTFAVGTDKEVYEVIKKDQVAWFKSPPPASISLDSNTYLKSVQIERIEFSEANKWRFFDGSSSFYATIADLEFINRIALNEATFSRGDTLRVEIEEKQRLDGDKLKSEYTILKVLDHRRGMKQISLPLSQPSADEE